MDTPHQVPTPLAWGPLLEAHPLAHFVYDTDSLALLAANEAALERYGYPREVFLRLTRADLLLPSELTVLRTFLAGLPGSAKAEWQHVWLERTADGRVLHADVRGLPVLFEGRQVRLAAVVDAGLRARLQADAGQARDLLVVAGRIAQLGGWSLDLQHGLARWSDEVCAIHEVPPGTEYRRDAVLHFYPDQAAAILQTAWRACQDDGAPFDLELPLVTARGQSRWVRVVGTAVKDPAGRVVAIEGAQQDITERHRVAQELAESGQRLAAVLDAIPDLWFIIDAEGRYREVSNPEHPSLSAPWDTKRGRPLLDTLEPEFGDQVLALLKQAQVTGHLQQQQYDMLTSGGELRSFEARMVPMRNGLSMVLIRDITETVQLEQRFQAMADAAPIAIFMTEADGVCTYANAACTSLLGVSPPGSGPTAWLDRATPACRARVEALWKACLHDAAPLEMEFQIRGGPAGAERTVVSRTNPIWRADGKASRHVGAVFDVTQARELEAARRAQAVAEEAGRRQSAFMSRVSHELRTPLNAILGFGQLLQQDIGPGASAAPTRTAEYAQHVVAAGQHMLELVDDLLELQRLGADSDVLPTEDVELADLVAESLMLLKPSAQGAAVDLVSLVPPGLTVRSHGRTLRQMVLNLCSNALKYGRRPAGRSRVVVSARLQADAVELQVDDQGPGLTPAQLEQLFRPFERLGQEGGLHAGSGLGLLITRQLAQQIGASVSLRSEPGRGTTAVVRLPR